MNIRQKTQKLEPWVMPVTIVCLFFGGLIAMLINSTNQDTKRSDANPLSAIISSQNDIRELRNAQKELEKAYKEKSEQYDSLINDLAKRTSASDQLIEELTSLRIKAGVIAIQGPGIIISIDDTNIIKPKITGDNAAPYLTHDIDILMLVNEMRAAGAEAIEINNERIAYNSAIRCVGPSIKVNDKPISAPFIIKAIGKPEELLGAANLPFGVLDGLRPLGMKIDVKKRDLIKIDALNKPQAIDYAKPSPETNDTTGSNQ
jgi:uncharacterized protein YlxW (UPF0749 family)